MTDPLLDCFREIAEAMDPRPKRWQWIGEFDSQRMFGIPEERAKELARRFGGRASEMPSIEDVASMAQSLIDHATTGTFPETAMLRDVGTRPDTDDDGR